MATTKDFELAKVSQTMMKDYFKVKKGETIVLTADSGSDMAIVEGFAQAAYAAGAKPMVIRVAQPRGEGQDAIPDLPSESLKGALLKANIWLEFNSQFLLYSDMWETVMKDNPSLRYLIIYDATIDQLSQIVNKVDVPLMGQLLGKINEMLEQATSIRVTAERGTDFIFEMNQTILLTWMMEIMNTSILAHYLAISTFVLNLAQ